MEKSIYDMVVTELLNRQKAVRVELSNRFRRTQPFHTEKVPDRELLYNYNKITPEMELSLRQSMGDDVMDDYKGKMVKLQEKYQGKGV